VAKYLAAVQIISMNYLELFHLEGNLEKERKVMSKVELLLAVEKIFHSDSPTVYVLLSLYPSLQCCICSIFIVQLLLSPKQLHL